MSWNLWWRFGPWAERQPVIAAVLAAEQPDLVGLQEVWVEEGGANQAEVLAGASGLHAAVGEVRFRDGLAFTNAVLSRWPLRTVERHRLPRADGSSSPPPVHAAASRVRSTTGTMVRRKGLTVAA